MTITRNLTRSITRALTRPITQAGAGGFNPASLFAAGEQGAFFDPNDLSTLFEDSAGTIPVTSAGQPVGKMLDKSGRGNHATQTTDALRPTVQVSSNGRYVLRFNGTTQYMGIAGSASTLKFMHDGTGATIMASVALASPLTASKLYPVAGNSATAARGFILHTAEAVATNIATQQLNITIGNGTTTVINGTSGGQGSVRGDGRGLVVGFTYKTQSGDDFRAYTDGDNFNLSRAESNAPSALAASADVQIGRTSTLYLAGDLYELVMVAKEVSAADRVSLVNHQRSLYGDDGFMIGVGDSHTYNTAYGFYMRQYYPALLEAMLRAGGQKLTSLNYGVSGNSTAQILARMSSVLEQGAPRLAIVYAGQNDVAIDTQANLQNIVGQIKATGCRRVLVVGSHYMNFSTGGDTTAAQDAGYATLRGKQSAAAAAAGAVYVDMYAWMRALIIGGTYAQGDFGWLVADGNTHLNVAGQQIVADAVYAAMQAQGWA